LNLQNALSRDDAIEVESMFIRLADEGVTLGLATVVIVVAIIALLASIIPAVSAFLLIPAVIPVSTFLLIPTVIPVT
jgi:hypothetical protein